MVWMKRSDYVVTVVFCPTLPCRLQLGAPFVGLSHLAPLSSIFILESFLGRRGDAIVTRRVILVDHIEVWQLIGVASFWSWY